VKKYIFIILVSLFSISIFGCGKKKEASLPEMPEPLSIEALSAFNATAPTPAVEASLKAVAVAPAPLEQLPPPGPYKPAVQEIQTALKNANFYMGAIDGKKGPLTKKAIEEFQKANGLEADGIVGPKTWAVLSKYSNPPPVTSGKR
jgi:peptidoglycan hydrolase-like protein with peptidoglycan-binding domain